MYAQIYGRTIVALQRRSSGRFSLKQLLSNLVVRLQEWQEQAHSRRLLATLDDRMLSDIGIDRATAAKESSAPFWR
jgi:uncharacterized protein YjiS (DUF1127 family)